VAGAVRGFAVEALDAFVPVAEALALAAVDADAAELFGALALAAFAPDPSAPDDVDDFGAVGFDALAPEGLDAFAPAPLAAADCAAAESSDPVGSSSTTTIGSAPMSGVERRLARSPDARAAPAASAP